MIPLKNYFIANFILKSRLEILGNKQGKYLHYQDNFEEITKWQLNEFNRIWLNACTNNEFYKWWSKSHSLPNSIDNLSQLLEFPALSKKVLQENKEKIFKNNKKYTTVSTGGSTGEPVEFITSSLQRDQEYVNTYLGRKRFGIKPLDTTILIWGHSHLFGGGLKGQFNELKRNIYDLLLNIRRLNAYDLSLKTVEAYAKNIIKSNPCCIIGYTSSVYSIARYILDNNIDIGNKSNLKGIIVTSETVTRNDIKVIEAAFKVPAIIEYGMAETSVIAYSSKEEEGLEIFWDSFIAQNDAENQLRITTLYEREFPLINYETSDQIIPKINFEGSLLAIDSIKGRKRDNIKLQGVNESDITVSGILVVHLLKGFKGIYSISYKQLSGNKLEVYVVKDNQIDLEVLTKSFFKLLLIEQPDVDISCIEIKEIETANKSIAGKTTLKID